MNDWQPMVYLDSPYAGPFQSGHNKRLLWFYTQKVKCVPILVRIGPRNGPAPISNIQEGNT